MASKDKIFVQDILTLSPDHIDTQMYRRFCCPYCTERRGKEDRDYKLYVNKSKRVGWCFKCQIAVIEQTSELIEISTSFDEELETLVSRIVVNLITSRYHNREDTVNLYDISDYPEISCGAPAYNYLEGRKGFNMENIQKYRMRSGKAERGSFVLVPNNDYGTSDGILTDFFQLRFYGAFSGSKYFHIHGSKPLVFLDRCIGENPEDLFITEGVFDAMAMGDNAIAVLGKYVTAEQSKALFCSVNSGSRLKRIILAYDGGVEEDSFNRTVYSLRKFFSIPLFKAVFPDGVDPEEAGGAKGCLSINRIF